VCELIYYKYSYCHVNVNLILTWKLSYLFVLLPCDAMLAQYMVSSCVRLSVHLSVSLSCHTPVLYKMAKRRITQQRQR